MFTFPFLRFINHHYSFVYRKVLAAKFGLLVVMLMVGEILYF